MQSVNPNELSPEEAAAIVGVDVSTLKRWARAGQVPGAWRTPGGWWRFTRAGLFEIMKPVAERER